MSDIFSLEEFAFNLLNQLADEYGIYDDGSFAYAIQNTNDCDKMNQIIEQLQAHLLSAMKSSVERFMR